MRLAVLKERRAGETRVAATPETVGKLIQLGLSVAVEHAAGEGASIADAAYQAAGAEIAPDAKSALSGAGIVFAVQPPEGADLAAIPRGALLVCISGAQADRSRVQAFAQAGIDVVAMELLPRITRAQSMDVLSSQANLAGYRAVVEGAGAFDRAFPMMMTAAGTVPPARVFVVGAGVAGLQAIATARRLGAIVSATDVRPAAKEEIKSLGAAFVGVEDTETAGQTGAYAKEMSQEFRRKQAELMAATVAKNDLVICTALVQGGRAPVIVTQAMVDAMRPGSVVVDIASDAGGNCEATRPGEAYVTDRGVKILGYRNWPGRIPVAASTLYAKNLLTFLTSFWNKDGKVPDLQPDDAIIQGVMLTRGGRVVHGNFGGDTGEGTSAMPGTDAVPAVAQATDAGSTQSLETSGQARSGAATIPVEEERSSAELSREEPAASAATPASATTPAEPADIPTYAVGPDGQPDAAAALANDAGQPDSSYVTPDPSAQRAASEASSGAPETDETGLTTPGFPASAEERPEFGQAARDETELPPALPEHEAASLPAGDTSSRGGGAGKKRGGGGSGGGGKNRPNQGSKSDPSNPGGNA